MSSIAILGGDWEILFDDEKTTATPVQGLKMIRKAVAAPTIITSNALYSAVTDAMDELNAMDDEFPMLPVTPTAYTMENGYFIPRSSTEYLKGGAIESVSWTDVIRMKPYAGGTNFVAGDIGREITESASGDTGTLLDFETLPDGTTVAWIRPEDPTPTTGDIFDSTSGTLSVTGDGGTGTVNVTVASSTGESLYSNVQAIGSVPTASETYLVQDRIKMTDSAGAFQWWATDSTVSLGIIDILIRVKLNDSLIADGDVELFSRRYTALYDNFRLNVAAGGRSAIPLASSPDINNTTGIRTTGTLTGVSGTFDVGNGFYAGASWSTATARGVITATNGNTELEYYLVGDLTDFSSSQAITEYDFTTATDGDASATTGTIANNSGGPADSASGEGGTVTVNFGDFNVDHDGDGTAEPYSIEIDAQSNVPASKVYERIKYLCRRGSGDPFNTPIGIDGEQWRGLSLQVAYDNPAGTLTDGVAIEVAATGWTAYNVHFNTAASPTYFTATDNQTSLDSLADNDTVREVASPTDTVDVDFGTGGGFPVESFTSPKQSPFGTFTGTQIFGARGVVYINPNSGESQSYILTDDNGVLRTPPNTVSVTVTTLSGSSNPVTSDRVLVARDTGTSGIIDKDQNGGLTTGNNIGDPDLAVASTIDSETPQSGVLRVVDIGNQDEQRYHYSSWSTTVFTLTAVTDATGTATAGSNSTTIIGTGTQWSTGGTPVVPGMLVRNTTDGTAFSEVLTVDSDTQLTVTDNGNTWASQAFEINQLVRTYGTDDNMYVPILDGYTTASTFTNTLVKTPASNFGVVINVRQGKVILPFTQNNTVNDNGGTFSAIRTPDTIAT